MLLRDPCVYCGGASTGLDHIHPSSCGGTDGWENRAPACQDCDGAKAHFSLIGFLFGARMAAKTVARRHYQNTHARRAALDMIRTRIAEQFYRGNIRGMENVRASTEG